MKKLDLAGNWNLSAQHHQISLTASVPGTVHLDLLAAGIIHDPFFRDNEDGVRWIGDEDWRYERYFDGSEFVGLPVVRLRCEGLDTIAHLTLNGHEIGLADNMHRTWFYDIRPFLKAGRNHLTISLSSPLKYITAQSATYPLADWHGPCEPAGRAWLRKMACNFGWDWGPVLPTCGIWRAISIEGFTEANIADLAIPQTHEKRIVKLQINTATINAPDYDNSQLQAIVRLYYANTLLHESRCNPGNNGELNTVIEVSDPQLWWPHGMGAQPLYDVVVAIYDRSGKLLDQAARRIGLRTLRLIREPDQWGESFYFAANNVPFFAKGANWIPPDALYTRPTRAEYDHLLRAAVAANMNMIRVWGGGMYEQPWFYDLCDELGLCVWQDFMFACSAYPSFDNGWMANVAQEAAEQVQRLRHHACLAIWVGNNEIEQGLVDEAGSKGRMKWSDYQRLFDELLPQTVNRLDSDRDYWPGSPHTPPPGARADFNDPSRGDAHLWNVWHGREPFEWYRTSYHRFCSEFGFQSLPTPRVLNSATLPEDHSLETPVMLHRQRSGVGNAVIKHYMAAWFREPVGFENMLWLSQIQQGLAMKYAVEHWRQSRPRCMGALYWQLNDCWPAISWSSIDSGGNWKALHYIARRFFAPLLISGVEDASAGTIAIHLCNDLLDPFHGNAVVEATNCHGDLLEQWQFEVNIPANSAARRDEINLAGLLKQQTAADLLVWLELRDTNNQVVSQNLVSFMTPKSLKLHNPQLEYEIKRIDEAGFTIGISAHKPALWCWIDLAETHVHCDDNFFCLASDEQRKIYVKTKEMLSSEAIKNQLRLRSLWDTWQPN